MSFKKDKQQAPGKTAQVPVKTEQKKKEHENKPKINFNSRKFKHGSMATIVTVLFIAAVILVNVVFNVLTTKFPMNIDLTQEQKFQLSQETIDFVKGIEKDATITILNDEQAFMGSVGDYSTQANNVIKQFSQYNNHIQVQYVNTSKNPTFTNKYSNKEITLSANNILVESGENVRSLALSDLFEFTSNQQTGGQSITGFKGEQVITSALLNVTSDKQTIVSVLTGYGEPDGLDAFKSLLESNGYVVKTQSIVTEEIDPETTVAIIFSPSRDYDENDLKKLSSFLNNEEKFGKTLLYVPDMNSGKTPNLDTFLAEWGVKVNDGMMAETDASMALGSPTLSYSNYKDTTFTEKLKNPEIKVIMPYSRPLEATNTDRVKVLLEGSEKSGIIPSDADENWSIEKDFTATGPIATALLSSNTKYDGTTPMTSNVLVIGSALSLSSQMLSSNAVNNSSYFINLLNDLAGREETITIESKATGVSMLSGITDNQVHAMGIVFAIVLPIAVLLVGLVIWMRRRNR